MKSILKKEKAQLLTILIVFLISFVFSYASWGSVLIDCGREAYIPAAISKGAVLYKDIFCIYGALPYFVNALFFKLFGVHIELLYFIGAILSFFYIFGFYFLSREFLSKKISLALTLLVLFSAIFNPSLFNFIFPYSYAMVFSSLFGLFFVFCLIKFIKFQKRCFFYLACVFGGLILCSKMDFAPMLFALAPVILIYKVKLSDLLRGFALFFAFPILTFLLSLILGASVLDILSNFSYLTDMINTKSLAYFYQNHGLGILSPKYIGTTVTFLISAIFIVVIYFQASLFFFRRKNKIVKYFGLILLTFLLLFSLADDKYVMFLPILAFVIFLFSLFNYLKIKCFKNPTALSYLILAFCALLSSIKVFYGLHPLLYGSYSLPLLFLVVVRCLDNILENNFLFNTKKQCQIVLVILISCYISLYLNLFLSETLSKKITIKTQIGTIKTDETFGKPSKEMIDYFIEHKNQLSGKKMIVLPEGIMYNFLLDKEWNFYPTSFIPLDFDTFGDEKLTQDLLKNRPDYVLFNGRSTEEYQQGAICKSYGVKMCKAIAQNYDFVAAFGDKFRIYLFKIKDESGIN